MRHRIFAYGILTIPEVMEALLERRLPLRDAALDGYARFRLRDRPYPGIVAESAAAVDGVLYEGVGEDEITLLDHFEGELYERRSVRVRTACEPRVDADAYVVSERRRGRLSHEPWDRLRFEVEHLAGTLDHCRRLGRAWRSRVRPKPPRRG